MSFWLYLILPYAVWGFVYATSLAEWEVRNRAAGYGELRLWEIAWWSLVAWVLWPLVSYALIKRRRQRAAEEAQELAAVHS